MYHKKRPRCGNMHDALRHISNPDSSRIDLLLDPNDTKSDLFLSFILNQLLGLVVRPLNAVPANHTLASPSPNHCLFSNRLAINLFLTIAFLSFSLQTSILIFSITSSDAQISLPLVLKHS